MSALEGRLGAAGRAFVAIWALALLLTLPHYGATWDEPEWFDTGDRYLGYLSTLERERLERIPVSYRYYGPFAAIVSAGGAAAVRALAAQVPDYTARHLGNAAFAVLAFFALARLLAARDGRATLLFGLAAFASLPRVFGHAHSNISDLPAASLYIATLAALVEWGRRGHPAALMLTGAAAGACGAVRPQTAIFLVPVALLFVALDPELRARVRRARRQVALLPVAALCALLLAWPLFWGGPLDTAAEILRFFGDPPEQQGVISHFYLGRTWPDGAPAHYPLVMLAITTPLPVLAAALAGALLGWRRHGVGTRLALVWLAGSTLNHVVLPRGDYDGVRHMLEAFGALAWLAGIGCAELLERLPAAYAPRRRAAAALLAAALVAPGLVAGVRLHPYPQVYYNALVGGTSGAETRFETDYWGFTVLEGLRRIARDHPQGAIVAVPYNERVFRYHAPEGVQIVSARAPQVVELLKRRRRGPRALLFAYHVRRGFLLPESSVHHVALRHTEIDRIERDGAALFRVFDLRSGPPAHRDR